MSRLWSERLQLLIASDQLLLFRERRGLGGFKTVQAISETVSTGQSVRAGVMEALRNVLERGGELRKVPTRVLISNEFVRYALVSDADELRDDDERMLAADHALKATFGAEVAEWKTTLSSGVGGKVQVAAGIDASFFDEILITLNGVGTDVTGVEPLLVDVLRELDPAYMRARDRGWIVVVEYTQIVLFMHSEGDMSLIRTQRRRGDLTGQVLAMLDQSCLQIGIDRIGGGVWAFSFVADDGVEVGAFPPESDWRLDAVSVIGPARSMR